MVHPDSTNLSNNNQLATLNWPCVQTIGLSGTASISAEQTPEFSTTQTVSPFNGTILSSFTNSLTGIFITVPSWAAASQTGCSFCWTNALKPLHVTKFHKSSRRIP